MPRRVLREIPAHCSATMQTMPDGWNAQEYPNSGVLVMRNTERMKAWKPAETAVGWADQNALMLDVLRGELRWKHLPRAWNFGHMHISGNLEKARTDPNVHFAHFTGTTYRGGRKKIMVQWWQDYNAERTKHD